MAGEMGMVAFESDALTARIIHCIIRVHQGLGPGFVEKVYRRALIVEFGKQRVSIETEKEVDIHYEGVLVGRHALDILVDGRVIVELKTVEALSHAHYAQVRSYLRATNLKVALPVNFCDVRADFRRIVARD